MSPSASRRFWWVARPAAGVARARPPLSSSCGTGAGVQRHELAQLRWGAPASQAARSWAAGGDFFRPVWSVRVPVSRGALAARPRPAQFKYAVQRLQQKLHAAQLVWPGWAMALRALGALLGRNPCKNKPCRFRWLATAPPRSGHWSRCWRRAAAAARRHADSRKPGARQGSLTRVPASLTRPRAGRCCRRCSTFCAASASLCWCSASRRSPGVCRCRRRAAVPAVWRVSSQGNGVGQLQHMQGAQADVGRVANGCGNHVQARLADNAGSRRRARRRQRQRMRSMGFLGKRSWVVPPGVARHASHQGRWLRKTGLWPVWLRRAWFAGSAIIEQGVAGQIDLVLREPRRHAGVFVEVRSRGAGDFGGAAASMGATKRQRIILPRSTICCAVCAATMPF